ncbi:hypothetical protein Patl1_37532 [Pistacia atlantica]|nr:hypothetical protein Patl1_37532 [Pistacia atlantica]
MGAWLVAGGVRGLVCDFSIGWSADGSRFSFSWCGCESVSCGLPEMASGSASPSLWSPRGGFEMLGVGFSALGF